MKVTVFDMTFSVAQTKTLPVMTIVTPAPGATVGKVHWLLEPPFGSEAGCVAVSRERPQSERLSVRKGC
ncbi:MAG TPA: hypothetical protein VF370_02145 [Candidatus Cryosericum sp.]